MTHPTAKTSMSAEYWVPTEARNKHEDLAGTDAAPGENPFNALIETCSGPTEIQCLYSVHRERRNAQQKEKFLSPEFKEVFVDPVLLGLEQAEKAGFRDTRNCLVVWARPPEHVLKLASHLQARLKEVAPGMWLMPPHRMHMTTLEVTHSRTPQAIAELVALMQPTVAAMAGLTYTRRSRLVKPMLSYDLAAVALTFVPAAGEAVVSPPPLVCPAGEEREIAHPGRDGAGPATTDGYSYHHLRRDAFDTARHAGVKIEPRYVVPSAHVTLGRFLAQDDHATAEMRARWVRSIEQINEWLRGQVWGTREGEGPFIGEWIVGQERGLDIRAGPLWYGGGHSLMVGPGF